MSATKKRDEPGEAEQVAEHVDDPEGLVVVRDGPRRVVVAVDKKETQCFRIDSLSIKRYLQRKLRPNVT